MPAFILATFVLTLVIIFVIVAYTLKNAKTASSGPVLPYRRKQYFFTRSEQ